MKRLHILWGWLFAGSFAATGFWMQHAFPAAWEGDRGMRMFYRSAHVYILLGALINSVLGAYWRPARTALRAWFQLAGSVSILLSPLVFTLAFCFEASPGGMSRPFSATGLAMAIFGALMHLAAQRGEPGAGGVAAAPAVTPGSIVLAALGALRGLFAHRRLRWALVALGVVLAMVVVRIGRERFATGPVVVSAEQAAGVLADLSIAQSDAERRAVERAVRRGHRFARVGNGTVIDVETDLMWAVRDSRNGVTWEEARLYADRYDAGGYSDWRLPSLPELLALARGMHGEGPDTAPGAPDVDPTLPVGYGVPWSTQRRGDEAARVHLSSGAVGWVPQTSTSHNRALPVRGTGRAPVDAVARGVRHVEAASARLFPPPGSPGDPS